jgi:hypothetical protein
MAKRGQFKTGQRMMLEQSSFIPFCPVGPVRASQFWFVSFAVTFENIAVLGQAV